MTLRERVAREIARDRGWIDWDGLTTIGQEIALKKADALLAIIDEEREKEGKDE